MSEAKPGEPSGRLPACQPVRLVDFVDYAAGAVVSKTIAKVGKSNLTLFAFDAGQAISEHSAPFDALVTVLDGATDLTVGGEKIHAETGETVLMPADIPHAVAAPVRFKMLLTMLRG